MTHCEHIKSLISPYINTLVYPKFLRLILGDIRFGSCYIKTEPESILRITSLINLCDEWIATGKKPDHSYLIQVIENAGYFVAAYRIGRDLDDADYISGFANWNSTNGFSLTSQLDILNNLIIEEDGLFTWEDYEKN